MTTELCLADDFALPIEAVTETFAIPGQTREREDLYRRRPRRGADRRRPAGDRTERVRFE